MSVGYFYIWLDKKQTFWKKTLKNDIKGDRNL